MATLIYFLYYRRNRSYQMVWRIGNNRCFYRYISLWENGFYITCTDLWHILEIENNKITLIDDGYADPENGTGHNGIWRKTMSEALFVKSYCPLC